MIATTVASVLAGYAIARFRFAGRDALLLIFLATQIFPNVLLIAPLLAQWRALGLTDNPPSDGVSLVLRASIDRAGTPATVKPGGTSHTATAPAPTTSQAPIRHRGATTAPIPRSAPSSTTTPPASATRGPRLAKRSIRQSCAMAQPGLRST
jgi:hypothetical protein